jgi:hypothetical protein
MQILHFNKKLSSKLNLLSFYFFFIILYLLSEFMETLLSVQPRMVADKGSENTPDSIVFKIAKDIEGRLPGLLVLRKEENMTSLNVFRS